MGTQVRFAGGFGSVSELGRARHSPWEALFATGLVTHAIMMTCWGPLCYASFLCPREIVATNVLSAQ